MTIDKRGKWWKGTDFSDLSEYINLFARENTYPVELVKRSICICGHTSFRLLADRDEGCVQRICEKCGEKTFIGDSAEYWEEAEPKKVGCPCKGVIFEVGVGFSFRQGENEIKWITVGERCIKCGILGSCADWKINYGPSIHLISLV